MRLTSVRRAPRANLTGFDPKAFAAAAGTPANDPWARAEAWRYSGPFTRFNRFKGSFPGLGIATVAFAAYCGYEYLFLNDGHGHGEAHGEGHH
ncbi:NADH-ubiquinone oxidoreductase B12 subunit family protein [Rhexocercosporidium sp. MPI-PUGE-AT-0058]|nr:NADH-ubiquinone oxidoreductase B12 subunit family protein [Rhexocercosporidium sp. MPI-PUGE-AT-0058]